MSLFKLLFTMQLHLNPVEAVVQLRPSIQKSRAARKKMRLTKNLEGVMKEEDIKGKKPYVSAKKQVLSLPFCASSR